MLWLDAIWRNYCLLWRQSHVVCESIASLWWKKIPLHGFEFFKTWGKCVASCSKGSCLLSVGMLLVYIENFYGKYDWISLSSCPFLYIATMNVISFCQPLYYSLFRHTLLQFVYYALSLWLNFHSILFCVKLCLVLYKNAVLHLSIWNAWENPET